MDKFRPDDIVAEASCHARHVFHSQCLNEWLRQRLICPLCKDVLQENPGRTFHQRVGTMLNCFRRRRQHLVREQERADIIRQQIEMQDVIQMRR